MYFVGYEIKIVSLSPRFEIFKDAFWFCITLVNKYKENKDI